MERTHHAKDKKDPGERREGRAGRLIDPEATERKNLS
jgi:hypothetical protein